MAKKEEIVKELPEEECGGVLYSATEDEDNGNSSYDDYLLSVGRHVRTFKLPIEDVGYGTLLNMEKDGKATIFNKQYCPCPKEGFILVLCEYDINF